MIRSALPSGPTCRRLLVPLAAMALAGGCAAPGPFPSLAHRAAESVSMMEEPERPRPFVPSEPALRARTAELLAAARRGHGAFEAAMGTARRRAERVGAAGGEGWIAAQQAVSVAEAARGPTVQALADLDALAIDRAARATNEEDFAALTTAVAEARRLADIQRAELARLSVRLGSR